MWQTLGEHSTSIVKMQIFHDPFAADVQDFLMSYYTKDPDSVGEDGEQMMSHSHHA